MKTPEKLLVLAVVLMGVGVVVAKTARTKDVKLSGVTAIETLLTQEPGQTVGRKVPKGIVVAISQAIGDEWVFVTIPASISDVLFDDARDIQGWLPRKALESTLSPRA